MCLIRRQIKVKPIGIYAKTDAKIAKITNFNSAKLLANFAIQLVLDKCLLDECIIAYIDVHW